MKIERLETTHFKRLGSGTWAFDDELTSVVGPNGQGKSTLLRAIFVALYGVAALPGKAEDVPSWGETTWGVTLALSHQGHQYTLTRSKASARMERDGELMASGHTPVTEYVADLLGMDLKDAHLLLFSRQGETAYALNYGATALQRKVEAYAGVAIVDQLARGAADQQRTLDAESLALLSTLPDDGERQATDDCLTETLRQAQTARAEAERTGEALSALPPVEPVSLAEVRGARARRDDWKAYQAARDSLETRRADLLEALARLPDVEARNPRELAGVRDRLKQQIAAWRQQKAQAERYAETLASIQAELAALPEVTDEQVAEAEQARDDAQALLKTAEAGLADVKAAISRLKKAIKDGVCPECQTVLDHDIDATRQKLAEAQERLPGHQQAVDSAEVEAKAAAVRAFDIVQARDKRRHWEQKLAALEPVEMPEDTDSSIERAEAELGEVLGALAMAEDAQEQRESLGAKLAALKAPEPVAEMTDEGVQKVEDAYEAHQEHQRTVADLTYQRDQAELKARHKEEEAAAIRTTLKKWATTRDDAEIKGLQAANFKRLAAYLKSRRAEYLEQVWTNILTQAEDFLVNATGGWLTGLRIEDGKFLFEEKGVWMPTAEASGAQASFIGTALRIGLARALHRRGLFLLLDEPTADMSEENARGLMAALAGVGRQVIAVSHRETDSGLSGAVVAL